MARHERFHQPAPKAPDRSSPILIALAIILAGGAVILIASAPTR